MNSSTEQISDIWSNFDFRQNPYRYSALESVAEDGRLFTGRELESEDFYAQMDTEAGGIVVISGDIGVGKTSFFNVMQYRMCNVTSGRRLIRCDGVVPISDPDPVTIARRIAIKAIDSVDRECATEGCKLPEATADLKSWLSHEQTSRIAGAGFTFLGTGGQITAPATGQSPKDLTLENWKKILETVVTECRKNPLSRAGIILCLDNAESLKQDQLNNLLIAYRDTLFSIKNIWWVIIGKTGLYQAIARSDRRISQRISGHGVVVPLLSASEFHALLDMRVKVYRKSDKAVTPLSEEVHSLLFNASKGTPRFVLHAGDALVRTIVAGVKGHAKKHLATANAISPKAQELFLTSALKNALIDNRIPDDLALNALKKLAKQKMDDMKLTSTQINLLMLIGDHELSIGDYQNLGFQSGEELATQLLSMQPFEYGEEIVHQRVENDTIIFSLKGYAAICQYFKILSDVSRS